VIRAHPLRAYRLFTYLVTWSYPRSFMRRHERSRQAHEIAHLAEDRLLTRAEVLMLSIAMSVPLGRSRNPTKSSDSVKELAVLRLYPA
jgi:hypothetical protein